MRRAGTIALSKPSTPCASAHARSGRRQDGAVFSGGTWAHVTMQLEVLGVVQGVPQRVLLDTGASMNLVAPRSFSKSDPELCDYIESHLRPAKQRLVGCSGEATDCR